MEQNDPVWIVSPFDTLLFKYWPLDHFEIIEDTLAGITDYEIVDLLTPNKCKNEYFGDNILRDTLHKFYKSPNLCDKYKFCQDVIQHSAGFKCVTAAGLRKRLFTDFECNLGPFNDVEFQEAVIEYSEYVTKRKNIGVLVFDFDSNDNNLRTHAMKVLYDNFYLYTTPIIKTGNSNNGQRNNKIIDFIIKQICRNTDCVIIFVDQSLIRRWNDSEDNVSKILSKSLCWDFKVKVLIISLCPKADETAMNIFKDFVSLKPVVIMYHQLIMAPSGGLIALVKQSAKLNWKNTIVKYWLRGWDVCNNFDNDRPNDDSVAASLV